MTPSGPPHLLVAINGNVGEWRDTLTPAPDRPRLPLPYAFGAALAKAGFRLSAIDLGATVGKAKAESSDTTFFEAIYPADELAKALGATDFALLWGRSGLSALVKQGLLPRVRRRLLYFSYVWQPRGTSTPQQRVLPAIARHASRFARGIVLMTAEHADAARATLPRHVPVIELQVGIDCGFYARPASLSDIAEVDRARVERLLRSTYVILPGDELRLNEDALTIVENSPLTIVRICQFIHRKTVLDLKAEIARRNLGDRLMIFERISYAELRFLMRHAAAYAGLVDASWQPAGWTVACECLASGLPVVLYEGLVSRELLRLGAGPDIVQTVPLGDTAIFLAALESMMDRESRLERAAGARAFAIEMLDLERTGAAFGKTLLQTLG